MTLNELRYIVAVAKYKHFGKAANFCYVSQPTLSMAIKKLEDQLNVIIFDRSNNDVQITELGQQLINQAQKILQETEIFKQIADQQKNPFFSALKVGVIYTIAPYIIPQVLTTLRHTQSPLELNIQENYTSVLLEKLHKNELDVLILSEPIRHDGLAITELYDEPFYVAFPKDHELAKYQQIDPQYLENEALVLLTTGNCFRDQVIKVCPRFQSEHNPLQKVLEGGSLQTIYHMVACGMGVTILPSTAVHHGLVDNELVDIRPFVLPEPTRRIILVTRSQFHRTEALNSLKETILKSKLASDLKFICS